jgi:hypothetical protein
MKRAREDIMIFYDTISFVYAQYHIRMDVALIDLRIRRSFRVER